MIDFHTPTLADKPLVDAVFLDGGCRSDDYCFGNIYIWRDFYKTRIAFFHGMPLIAFDDGPCGTARYLFPLGGNDADTKEALCVLSHEPDARIPFTLAGVTEEMKTRIETLFPGAFDFDPRRDLADYLYNVPDLVNLSGRKYHGKRNHLTRFKRLEWRIEPLNEANFETCARLNDDWRAQNDTGADAQLAAEYDAVRESLANFGTLGFSGGLLYQEDRPVAFTIGERICRDTFGVHIEKAFSDVEGAYTAVNREFLSMACGGYDYVNREEDVGDEGLRKAKLSYHPAILLDKYTARLKEGCTL